MKIIVILIISTLASINLFATQGEVKCSPENMEKIISKSAKFIGETGLDDNKITKLFLDPEYEKLDPKELKTKFFNIKKESKSGKIAEELMLFAKQHPECDKNGNFTIKK
ncbi:MAG: hypothetical protein ACXWR0_04970 [Bdellovibrio sp.]